MNVFSKEKLLKIVASAKKYWWLFVPVLLLLMIGYFIFFICDALQILLLHIRNFFLTIGMLIRKGAHGVASFFSSIAHGIAKASSIRQAKISQGLKSMSENAKTARTQLLNGAIDYCTDKVQRRQEKKQRLNQIAQELKSDTAKITAKAELPTMNTTLP